MPCPIRSNMGLLPSVGELMLRDIPSEGLRRL
jgi:hypothetical protein